ncbi:MAG: hypothetical protein WC438_02495 [Candidatus Pacearchaeota archaeon]
MKMRLSKGKLWILIIGSFILGFVAQSFFISDASRNVGFFNKYLGFTILIPLFVFLFVIYLQISKIKSKISIIILSIIMFEIILILNMKLYSLSGGPTSDMYGIIFFIGFIPALIIGLFYGILIAYSLDKKEQEVTNENFS